MNMYMYAQYIENKITRRKYYCIQGQNLDKLPKKREFQDNYHAARLTPLFMFFDSKHACISNHITNHTFYNYIAIIILVLI